jgi:hypothetical protein
MTKRKLDMTMPLKEAPSMEAEILRNPPTVDKGISLNQLEIVPSLKIRN